MIRKKRFKWVDKKLKNFLFNFFSKNFQFKYRNQIRICSIFKKRTFHILNEDLREFDHDLFVYLVEKPFECMNCFEFIVNKILKSFFISDINAEKILQNTQVILIPSEKSDNFKNLTTKNLEKLVSLEVKVISVSGAKIRISNLRLKKGHEEVKKILLLNNKIDKNLNSKEKETKYGFQEKSFFSKPIFTDFQIIKVSDFLETKKHHQSNNFFLLLIEKEMVGKLLPGKIVKITGVYMLNNFFISKNDPRFIKKTLIHVLGFQKYEEDLTTKLLKRDLIFDIDFFDLIKSKNIYNWIVSTICPDVFGQNQIKAGLAVLLFAGNYADCKKKSFFDCSINMLVIGDDDSFRNNLFYFTKKIKIFGSVIMNQKNLAYENDLNFGKNPTTDCFFDSGNYERKFKKKILYLKDMEKKTEHALLSVFDLFYGNKQIYKENNYQNRRFMEISILAGISEKFIKKMSLLSAETRILNLYNLSNFDLIFPIKNSKSILNEKKNVRYYFKSKKNREKISLPFFELNRISTQMLEKYLNFTRDKPNPFLSKEATVILRNAYLFMRINIKKNHNKNEKKYFTVSIKQLESLIKISESLGKMKISNFISVEEVFEAVRLFQKRFFL